MCEDFIVKRHINRKIPRPNLNTLVMLTGARQTGKTTTARLAYPELPYYNLDALEFRDQLEQVSAFSWSVTVGNCILDEIQKLPPLMEKLKFAYDAGQVHFSVLLGSAQILLMRSISETLAGRVLLFELWPMMLSEYMTRDGSPLSPPILHDILTTGTLPDVMTACPPVVLGEARTNAIDCEQAILARGGMPGLIHLPPAHHDQWLKSYAVTYLQRDLTDLARIHDLKPFRKLQQLTALRSSGLLSYSELARDTGVSVETVRRYMEYLRISYQVIMLPTFRSNRSARLVKTPKVYLTDIGLLRSLSGFDGPVTGELFETYVICEVAKYIRTLGLKVDMSFYRTHAGMEVDLILETPRGIIACEIKNRDAWVKKDLRNLVKLRELYGDTWQGGFLIYRGDRLEPVSDTIWAIPSWRLLMNPGSV